ncbi:MAG: hypothetical protein HF962_08460 [Sulfurovum sp.]|nr:hypothetical protein [Sulfurovum sp.]
MMRLFYVIIISSLFFSNFLYSIEESKIPPALAEWTDWVLDDAKDRQCPINYQTGETHCAWFRGISLSLDNKKLDFNMSVTLYKDDTKVLLPSAQQAWVEDISVNGAKAIVLESQSKPILILDKGSYEISGSISWNDSLKYLQLPKSLALVTLYKHGKRISDFSIDSNSRLWLDKSSSDKAEKGSLSVSIYRKVIDGHPLKMKTYLYFSVSGEMRSVVLDGIVLDRFLPTAINSSLDATIIDEKKLKVQIKAGEWTIMIDSYTPHKLMKLKKPQYEFSYSNQEIWSLSDNPRYRTIEIVGATAIDPTQSNLPEKWKKLPAYLVENKTFEIKELYRSASQQQKNKFTLNRDIWLDFDGKGYTISDKISAKISEIKRLEAKNILDLASVSINSKPTLITKLADSSLKGIELRGDNLIIDASSRYKGEISLPPASGWSEKFDSIATTLHLPAGWRLFASFGSDAKTSSWIDNWNLMDIFLVLLLSIGIYQLYGWRWSMPSTLFMILLWHESNAPTVIWLFVLAFIALLRVLDEGKIRSFIGILMVLVMSVAVLQVLKFSVKEIRTALYPQLEKQYHRAFSNSREEMDYGMNKRVKDKLNMSSKKVYSPKKKIDVFHSQIMQNRIDPNAVVQAGIAKPAWSWNSHRFSWQSAVGGDERLELWLVSPVLSKVLKVLHIIGMLFLLYMFLREFVTPALAKKSKNGVKALALLLVLVLSPNTIRADIPSSEILEELKGKLTRAPSCLPDCASIKGAKALIVGDMLEIRLDISAGIDVSIPILGNRNTWLPSVVSIDDKKVNLDIDDSGGLWLMLPKGTHEVKMFGNISGHKQIMLVSALPLHNLQTTSENKLWQIYSDNKSYIEIKNLNEQKKKEKEKSRIEPLVKVERTLYFGQRWYIDTKVKLLNQIDKPYTFYYTLLPNESILNKDIELRDAKVILRLGGKKSYYHWRSSIPITATLDLDFPNGNKHIEIWKMDISPIWSVDYKGIEPIDHMRSEGILMPRFMPWQTESLQLAMHRAKAVAGEVLSIESSKLSIVQSGRFRDLTLELNIKSSKAGQYTISLDGVRELKPTVIDEKNHYLKISKGEVSIPLQTKAQKVKLSWREEAQSDRSYIFPTVNLNKDSVNSSIKLRLPYNQWILWTSGPTLGPAVLLWGVLLAVLLFSLILGKIKNTPLATRDWLLLGLGVSTTSIFIMIPVILWIFALRYKEQKGHILEGRSKNMLQVGLVVLTLIALSTIIAAVSSGLLGSPDMMIAGNNSYGHNLNWYSDRIGNILAEPTVISVSIWYYRGLMLLWSIWIAFSLIGWLKWAWNVFAKGGTWAKTEKTAKAVKTAKK